MTYAMSYKINGQHCVLSGLTLEDVAETVNYVSYFGTMTDVSISTY